MPSIDLIVNEVVVRGRDDRPARSRCAQRRREDGVPVWQLDKLELSNPDATLAATANWRAPASTGNDTDADPAPTSAPARPARRAAPCSISSSTCQDAGVAARPLRPAAHAEGRQAARSRATWRGDGGPTAIDLPTLERQSRRRPAPRPDPQGRSGRGEAARHPQPAKPRAPAHARLPRRHRRRGCRSRSVTGTAKIQNGIGRTDNFTMVTAPARVELKGSVDLPTRNPGPARAT